MAAAAWNQRISDRLPIIGRLRRQRDLARRECDRLVGVLSEVLRRDGAFLAQRGELKLLLDPQSLVDRCVFGKGDWEGATIELMGTAARAIASDPRRKLFLDIGAHWGLYALSMWRLGVFDEIHCYEPEPHNFAQLGAQVFLNGASYAMTLHPQAALDKAGAARIQRATFITDGNRGSAALTNNVGDNSVAVAAVAIDDEIRAEGAIVFVKIDAERSEPLILDGMQRLIAANDIYLQLEVQPGMEQEVARRIPTRLRPVARRHWEQVYASFDWEGTPRTPAG